MLITLIDESHYPMNIVPWEIQRNSEQYGKIHTNVTEITQKVWTSSEINPN